MRVGCTGYFLYAGHHNNYFTSGLSPDLLGHPVRWICHHLYVWMRNVLLKSLSRKDHSTEPCDFLDSVMDGTSSGSPIWPPSQTKPTNVHKLAPNVYSAEMPKPFFPITGNWSFPFPSASLFNNDLRFILFSFRIYPMISNGCPHLAFWGIWTADNVRGLFPLYKWEKMKLRGVQREAQITQLTPDSIQCSLHNTLPHSQRKLTLKEPPCPFLVLSTSNPQFTRSLWSGSINV